MNIPFWKMHGAGNDFVLFDDRADSFPSSDTSWLSGIGNRQTGIGCEGIILIQNSTVADFRMIFFNPDGKEAEMCGNGARCAALLAKELGITSNSMTIETIAGIIKAELIRDLIRLETTAPSNWKTEYQLEVNGEEIICEFINTGVPHTIIEVNDLNTIDVEVRGSAIRYHPAFAPAGTNVNFIQYTGKHNISIRTYERGVEGETGACGTGAIAGALTAVRSGKAIAPVEVSTRKGDVLTIDFDMGEGCCAENISLTGPAIHVYKGTIEYS
jgi:diaminopimelate epimerase